MKIYIVEWDSGILYDGDRHLGDAFRTEGEVNKFLSERGLEFSQSDDVIYPSSPGLVGLYLQEGRKNVYDDTQYGRFARVYERYLM